MLEQFHLKRIRINGGTQSRVTRDQQTVDEYAEAKRAGAEFPAIVVFFDGTVYWLADGFHRYFAWLQLGLLKILAEIREGTQRDAILFAVGTNDKHGLRRNNADKRHCVEMLLKDREWGTWPDREIARRTGTDHRFVAKIKALLSGDCPQMRVPVQVTRNGTTYTQQPRAAATRGEEADSYPSPEEEEDDTEAQVLAEVDELLTEARGALETLEKPHPALLHVRQALAEVRR